MIRISKQASFAFLSCALFVSSAWAQNTYNAASCNESDVQAAISKEQANPVDGDVITIPSGTCTWTGSTLVRPTFPNTVTIQGAGAVSSLSGGTGTTGTDQTVILDGMTSSNLIQINTTAGKTFRWTGIALEQNSSSTASHTPMLNIGGASTAVRVDHCHFYSTISGNEPLAVGGSVQGVADHNFFDASSGIITFSVGMYNGSTWNGDTAGYGDGSWADTDHFGTSEFFYVEDSRINNGGVGDCTWGGRFVYRYFTAINSQVYSHGTTNGRERGCRAGEVYQGTFTASSAYNVSIAANGGSLLAWGNSSTAYRWLVETSYVRENNATYTYAAPPNGWGYCGTAQTGATSAWDQNTSPTTGYACLDAPGRGAGDLLAGANFPSVINSTTGTQTWPHQALDPIYVWDNTYSDGGYTYDTEGVLGNNAGGTVSDNVDYYQQVGTYGEPGTFNGTKGVGQGVYSSIPSSCSQGVGYWATDQNMLYVCKTANTWTAYYQPYTYPHPLTQSAANPAPPTNVQAVAH